MSDVQHLLGSLRRSGVQLWSEEGRLHYRAPPGSLSDQQVEHIRQNKEQILDILNLAQLSKLHASTNNNNIILIKNGPARPIFLYQHITGGFLGYSKMIDAIGPDASIYGVRCAEHEKLPSIEAMAEKILAVITPALCEMRPVLCGWSFGGILAFECARQLSLGRKLSLPLILIDAVPGAVADTANFDPEWLWRKFWFYIRREMILNDNACESEFWLSSSESRVELLADWISGHRGSKNYFEYKPNEIRSLFDIFSGNLMALRQYRPAPFAGEMFLIRATLPASRAATVVTRWRDTVAVVHDFPIAATHYGILRGSASTGVAQAIRSYMS